MSNPLIDAFFVGRAVAEVLSEQAEAAFSEALSELGKFDAEQRENLRQFTEQVMERAERAKGASAQNQASTASTASAPFDPGSQDLQTMIDDLRAEIAQLRSSLQQYRSRSDS